MADTFTCENCKGVFEKAWTDEESEKEALVTFGSPIDDPVMICTPCYKAVMLWGKATGELDQEQMRLKEVNNTESIKLDDVQSEEDLTSWIKQEMFKEYNRLMDIEFNKFLYGDG